MLVLVGESGSGKSTIEKILISNFKYHKVVSYTTREPRENEIDGVDYNFVSEEEFKKLQNADFFVETAEYNGWYYGTANYDCVSNRVAVLTPHGLRQLSKINGLDIVSFYIDVPRRNRLIRILERGDDIEESYRRNLSDVGAFDGITDEVDYVIDTKNINISSPSLLAIKINYLYKKHLSQKVVNI